MKVTREGKTFELQGGEAWSEARFRVLKQMNAKGKVCVIETDGKREKYLLPIGELEVQEEPFNY